MVIHRFAGKFLAIFNFEREREKREKEREKEEENSVPRRMREGCGTWLDASQGMQTRSPL